MATDRVRRSPRADTTRSEESKVFVTVADKRGSKTKDSVIEVHKFITEPAFIRVSAGVTKSTGNYESLRVDVAVTRPCYVEAIDTVYAEVAEYVAEKLDAEIRAYLGDEAEAE